MANPFLGLLLLCLALLSPAQGADLAPATTPVKFGDALFPAFKHDRCLHCHQFNSRNHNGRGFTSHRSRYLCDNCHTPRITGLPPGDWSAPPEIMDYTDLGPRETCLLIKRNMGARDNEARLAQHLLHDTRILWGLENGMTPSGKFPSVPGGYPEWVRNVNAWVADGMLCE